MELIYTIDAIHETAIKLLDYFQKNPEFKTVIFDGKMGSGKTTLIKELCNILGVEDEVTSPTFAIINEYQTKNDDFVYHFDFYRLKDIQEAIDIGTEDYFYSGNYCFVEWPDVIMPILPSSVIIVKIDEIDASKRKLYIEKLKN